MAMGCARYRFDAPPSLEELRSDLRRRVGARRAGAYNVELTWHEPGVAEALTPDGVALAHFARVCVGRGGVRTLGDGPLPAWSEVPWVELPVWTRLRLWIGLPAR